MSQFRKESDRQKGHNEKDRPTLQLFRQSAEPDGSGEGHVSLSAYISKHFQESDESPTTGAVTQQNQFLGSYQPMENALPTGQRIDALDMEMTSGLERYMPTPLFRLRVAKKRLDEQISELRMRLNKYQRLVDTHPEHSAQDLQNRMIMLYQRLEQLELHERQVSRELSDYLQSSGFLYRFLQGWNEMVFTVQSIVLAAFKKVRTLVMGPAKQEWETLNQDLTVLNEIMRDNMRSSRPASGEISQVVHQYEQTLRRMEKLLNQRKEKRGLFGR